MRTPDLLRFARDAATGSPLRTVLLVLAISIGVAAVVVLTALGDGARRYVMSEFSSLGTNLVVVLPGRSQTGGFSPANAISGTSRDLTIDDAMALLHAEAIRRVAPLAIGTSEISVGSRLREVMVGGTTSQYIQIRELELAQGSFLPDEDWSRGSAVAVIGANVRTDLFGTEPAVGRLVRVGGRRLLIIGVLASSGQTLAMNTDEIVLVPVAQALSMFNSSSLFRIMIEARNRQAIPAAKTQALSILKQRHENEEDVTIVTQDAVLSTFDRLLSTLTLGVAGIAAISLAVAGILVMNVMLVSVVQRTDEIGLLKALGASGRIIQMLFLAEAGMLSLVGAGIGFLLGQAGAAVIRQFYPTFPAYPPDWAVLAGLGTALATGIIFGVAPARRAAALDPVEALAKH
ncbi:MAG TPA: ABC transporter permease [Rhodocyclaceae bacterium]|nr:ABC transporter permease [Rhodocyclaceae bacterium]